MDMTMESAEAALRELGTGDEESADYEDGGRKERETVNQEGEPIVEERKSHLRENEPGENIMEEKNGGGNNGNKSDEKESEKKSDGESAKKNDGYRGVHRKLFELGQEWQTLAIREHEWEVNLDQDLRRCARKILKVRQLARMYDVVQAVGEGSESILRSVVKERQASKGMNFRWAMESKLRRLDEKNENNGFQDVAGKKEFRQEDMYSLKNVDQRKEPLDGFTKDPVDIAKNLIAAHLSDPLSSDASDDIQKALFSLCQATSTKVGFLRMRELFRWTMYLEAQNYASSEEWLRERPVGLASRIAQTIFSSVADRYLATKTSNSMKWILESHVMAAPEEAALMEELRVLRTSALESGSSASQIDDSPPFEILKNTGEDSPSEQRNTKKNHKTDCKIKTWSPASEMNPSSQKDLSENVKKLGKRLYVGQEVEFFSRMMNDWVRDTIVDIRLTDGFADLTRRRNVSITILRPASKGPPSGATQLHASMAGTMKGLKSKGQKAKSALSRAPTMPSISPIKKKKPVSKLNAVRASVRRRREGLSDDICVMMRGPPLVARIERLLDDFLTSVPGKNISDAPTAENVRSGPPSTDYRWPNEVFALLGDAFVVAAFVWGQEKTPPSVNDRNKKVSEVEYWNDSKDAVSNAMRNICNNISPSRKAQRLKPEFDTSLFGGALSPRVADEIIFRFLYDNYTFSKLASPNRCGIVRRPSLSMDELHRLCCAIRVMQHALRPSQCRLPLTSGSTGGPVTAFMKRRRRDFRDHYLRFRKAAIFALSGDDVGDRIQKAIAEKDFLQLNMTMNVIELRDVKIVEHVLQKSVDTWLCVLEKDVSNGVYADRKRKPSSTHNSADQAWLIKLTGDSVTMKDSELMLYDGPGVTLHTMFQKNKSRGNAYNNQLRMRMLSRGASALCEDRIFRMYRKCALLLMQTMMEIDPDACIPQNLAERPNDFRILAYLDEMRASIMEAMPYTAWRFFEEKVDSSLKTKFRLISSVSEIKRLISTILNDTGTVSRLLEELLWDALSIVEDIGSAYLKNRASAHREKSFNMARSLRISNRILKIRAEHLEQIRMDIAVATFVQNFKIGYRQKLPKECKRKMGQEKAGPMHEPDNLNRQRSLSSTAAQNELRQNVSKSSSPGKRHWAKSSRGLKHSPHSSIQLDDVDVEITFQADSLSGFDEEFAEFAETLKDNHTLASQLINGFLNTLYAVMLNNPESPTCQQEFESREAVLFVAEHIYAKLFQFLLPVRELWMDNKLLTFRMENLSHITLANLGLQGIPSFADSPETWAHPISLARNLNFCYSPLSKIRCMTDCFKAVVELVHVVDPKQNLDADTCLSALVYVIIHARPAFLFAHVKFIEWYTGEYASATDVLTGEMGYCYSQWSIALEYVKGEEIQKKVVNPSPRASNQNDSKTRKSHISRGSYHIKPSFELARKYSSLSIKLKGNPFRRKSTSAEMKHSREFSRSRRTIYFEDL